MFTLRETFDRLGWWLPPDGEVMKLGVVDVNVTGSGSLSAA